MKKKANTKAPNPPKKENPDKKVTISHSKYPVVLGLIGGIITILIGIFTLVIEISNNSSFGIGLSIWGIATGMFMIFGVSLLKDKEHFNVGSIVLLVVSILSLITVQGLVIGPLIALVGAILSRSKKFIEI